MTVMFENGEKVTASKDVLNELSLAYRYASERWEQKNLYVTAELYEQRAHTIYDALDETGYYDE